MPFSSILSFCARNEQLHCREGRRERGRESGRPTGRPFQFDYIVGHDGGGEGVVRGAGRVSVNAWRRVECVLNPTKRAHAQYLPLLSPHSCCGYPAAEDSPLALV